MTGDREQVDAVLARAPGAFERLVREHQALVAHVVGRIVRDREDARDLCQETFLRVHRQLHQFRGESSLRTWIGRVAYTIALRWLQKKRLALVEPSSADDDDYAPGDQAADAFDLEAAWADAEIATELHAAIARLSPLHRTLLTLYHLDELPIGEIAAITGLADGTIKSHLFRTRARLRTLLQARIGVTT